MNIIVLVMSGKGMYSSADFVKVETFDSYDVASKFCKENTNNSGKYWSLAQIVNKGENVETVVEPEDFE